MAESNQLRGVKLEKGYKPGEDAIADVPHWDK